MPVMTARNAPGWRIRLAAAAALLQLLLSPERASSLDNGLGRVPIRGVTSWCMQGRCGWDRCWDAEYRSLADAMVDEGMKASGYRYLHVDDCWVGGRNVTTGELYPDPERFVRQPSLSALSLHTHTRPSFIPRSHPPWRVAAQPHGMASLVEYVHGKGLLFGIYTDVTQNPCIHGQYDDERGRVPGSYGHYATDAATFARWGVSKRTSARHNYRTAA